MKSYRCLDGFNVIKFCDEVALVGWILHPHEMGIKSSCWYPKHVLMPIISSGLRYRLTFSEAAVIIIIIILGKWKKKEHKWYGSRPGADWLQMRSIRCQQRCKCNKCSLTRARQVINETAPAKPRSTTRTLKPWMGWKLISNWIVIWKLDYLEIATGWGCPWPWQMVEGVDMKHEIIKIESKIGRDTLQWMDMIWWNSYKMNTCVQHMSGFEG